jgi:tripartite-type tricarboxylate transporter receptor subunit TctC
MPVLYQSVLKSSCTFIMTLIVLALLPIDVLAQSSPSYPSQPIRLYVGSVPGASSDTYARIISEPLGKVLGQSIVIENRSGASGIIATSNMINLPADGYTLQLIYTPHTLSPYLFKKLNYDPIKEIKGL